jgi:hypothetical protein
MMNSFCNTNDKYLFSLIPRPIEVNTGSVSGKLFIEGNIAENSLRFYFEFADPLEAAPLLLAVEAAGKWYRCYCTIRSGSAVLTPVFHPEFCVGQKFTVKAVDPLARFDPEPDRGLH